MLKSINVIKKERIHNENTYINTITSRIRTSILRSDSYVPSPHMEWTTSNTMRNVWCIQSSTSSCRGVIMQLAIDVFTDMMKSKEIYIIIGACIIMWIALERMDR